MNVNRMFRRSSNLLLVLGLPGSVLMFVMFGLQTTSLTAQLAFSCAAVCLVFTVLVFLPYFFERHAQMRSVYMRYDALQAIERIRTQRTQHYVLNRALNRHQYRGRLASVRSF